MKDILEKADKYHEKFGWTVHDRITEATFARAKDIVSYVTNQTKDSAPDWQQRLDRILTSRIFGAPIMIALLALVFWLTIAGANIPSAFLAGILIEEGGLGGWFAESLV
jgi:ferrous iron transport protein B